ncbi:MAG: hypothetical protein Q9214_001842 [Letrouitia sp. 1 TL-2023]
MTRRRGSSSQPRVNDARVSAPRRLPRLGPPIQPAYPDSASLDLWILLPNPPTSRTNVLWMTTGSWIVWTMDSTHSKNHRPVPTPIALTKVDLFFPPMMDGAHSPHQAYQFKNASGAMNRTIFKGNILDIKGEGLAFKEGWTRLKLIVVLNSKRKNWKE